MRVYFDNAATTPISDEVVEVMTSCLKEHYGNPSSIHADGRRVRAALEEARKTVAQCIGASIGEIFFTSGGTESNNMALKCAVRDLGVTRIITSPTEHHCILHTIENLTQFHNVKVEYLDVCNKGKTSLQQLEELLANSTEPTLVSLMHANNEIGTMIDLDKVSEICDQYNAFFHSDTVQTVGHFPLDVDKTKIHFLSGAAHKFHGPKGVGFIYVNGDVSIKPFIDGGSQERNMRGGTENVYGIVGLAKALELSVSQMNERKAHIEGIRDYMAEQLNQNFKGIQLNGDFDGDRLYTVLSVSFPASPRSEMLLLSLDISGISASGGSACSSGAETGSHVMQATKAEPGRKTIRFSFSHYNTKEEVDFVVEKLKAIVPQEIEIGVTQ
jgi:cysteine desulfurase